MFGIIDLFRKSSARCGVHSGMTKAQLSTRTGRIWRPIAVGEPLDQPSSGREEVRRDFGSDDALVRDGRMQSMGARDRLVPLPRAFSIAAPGYSPNFGAAGERRQFFQCQRPAYHKTIRHASDEIARRKRTLVCGQPMRTSARVSLSCHGHEEACGLPVRARRTISTKPFGQSWYPKLVPMVLRSSRGHRALDVTRKGVAGLARDARSKSPFITNHRSGRGPPGLIAASRIRLDAWSGGSK